ncbi:MAG: hypothetical protein H0U74_21530 [Bradymonadaceae bacterium]|nr:hypothetical protein [Lujinxingiaceae bacterium]
MNMPTVSKGLRLRLEQFHGHQGGAVALLVMAAILICFMIALVIYDAGTASRDKITVSAAADAAAWSQSAVEARSMNMLAFTNVAKRITFGMTSYYIALWMAFVALLVIAIAAAVACWLLNIPAFGALTALCNQLTEFAIKTGIIMGKEAKDLGIFASDLNSGYFKDDMVALDKYQAYMISLTPWWSWSEQFLRGNRNGATVTASFPAPALLPSSISGTAGQSGRTDMLPVEKNVGRGYDNMCRRVFTDYDIVIHLADFGIKSGPNECKSGGWQPPVICALTSLMAVPLVLAACELQEDTFGDEGAPYEMRTYANAAQFQLETSNLVFAYKASDGRMSTDRKKFGFVKKDYKSMIPLVHKASGYWALSRSEISFQEGAPNLWYPSWTARMRPVALPGEWANSGVTLRAAWRDAMPYMIVTAALTGLINGTISLESAAADILRIEFSAAAMNNANMDGVSR